jgi:LPXTG-site transpeptidase (sortase) family protein
MVIFSFVALLLTYFPILALESQQKVREIWLDLRLRSSSGFGRLLGSQAEVTPTPPPLPPENRRFQLVIPKIGADSCILPNVDPGDQSEYGQALEKCVAHARGSGFPGEGNSINRTIYLFAHSTDAPYNVGNYNAIFYSLKDLQVGDRIVVWFWGDEFAYFVTDKKILPPQDTQFFKPQTQTEQLVLQTCYPPGTAQKQLVVIAKPLH